MAPEVMMRVYPHAFLVTCHGLIFVVSPLQQEYNKSIDIYAFGIILWELLTCEEPFPQYSDWESFYTAVCVRDERPIVPIVRSLWLLSSSYTTETKLSSCLDVSSIAAELNGGLLGP